MKTATATENCNWKLKKHEYKSKKPPPISKRTLHSNFYRKYNWIYRLFSGFTFFWKNFRIDYWIFIVAFGWCYFTSLFYDFDDIVCIFVNRGNSNVETSSRWILPLCFFAIGYFIPSGNLDRLEFIFGGKCDFYSCFYFGLWVELEEVEVNAGDWWRLGQLQVTGCRFSTCIM